MKLRCAECSTVQAPREGEEPFGMCVCGGELYDQGKCLAPRRGHTSPVGWRIQKTYCLKPAGHDGPHEAVTEWT